MRTYCGTILRTLEAGQSLVSATVVACRGSAPRTAGARMLLHADGSIWGTVGGGQYEAEMTLAGKRLLDGTLTPPDSATRPALEDDGSCLPAVLFHFSLRQVNDMDMICGGDISILLTLIHPKPEIIKFFQQAVFLEGARDDFYFLSRLHFAADALAMESTKSPREGFPGNLRPVTVVSEKLARKAKTHAPLSGTFLTSSSPTILADPDGAWLCEPFSSAYRVHIFGAGHVATALARFTVMADFPTTALDDRPEFANSARFPDCGVAVLGSLNGPSVSAYLAKEHIGPKDGIVILTRGHAHDRDVLAAALKTRAGYIGMIGSSSKRNRTYADLIGNGYTPDDLGRVCSPIGLDIGAQTPEEIAVSIVAELVQWRNGRSLKKAQEAL